FAPIRGIWASIFAPFRRLGEGSVDQSAVPIDLVRPVQFGQQQGVQLDPDAGSVPKLQVVTAGLAATTPKFGRQVVPGNTGLEDEQDAGENLTVIQRLASGKTKAAPRMRRQQRLDSLPERIGYEQLHGESSMASGDQPPDHQCSCARAKRQLFFIISERSK